MRTSASCPLKTRTSVRQVRSWGSSHAGLKPGLLVTSCAAPQVGQLACAAPLPAGWVELEGGGAIGEVSYKWEHGRGGARRALAPLPDGCPCRAARHVYSAADTQSVQHPWPLKTVYPPA